MCHRCVFAGSASTWNCLLHLHLLLAFKSLLLLLDSKDCHFPAIGLGLGFGFSISAHFLLQLWLWPWLRCWCLMLGDAGAYFILYI